MHRCLSIGFTYLKECFLFLYYYFPKANSFARCLTVFSVFCQFPNDGLVSEDFISRLVTALCVLLSLLSCPSRTYGSIFFSLIPCFWDIIHIIWIPTFFSILFLFIALLGSPGHMLMYSLYGCPLHSSKVLPEQAEECEFDPPRTCVRYPM